MPIFIEFANGNLLLQENKSAVIGRAGEVDVLIDHHRVSRHHLSVRFEDGSWIVKDLESANGSFHNGSRISQVKVVTEYSLTLGGIEGPSIEFKVLGRAKFPGGGSTDPRKNLGDSDRLLLSERTRVGRDPENDICLDDDLVSRYHCEILTKDGEAFEVVDLGSSNGTFVNGRTVKRNWLQIGDVLEIGSTSYIYVGGSLEKPDSKGGDTLDVESVYFHAASNTLLENVNFSLKPNSITAILGPSGAGKSTLMNIINGSTRPTEGEVWFGGRNLHENIAALQPKLGFVPQNDLLHTNLKLRQALEYAAELRFPRDTSSRAKAKRIDKVLAELGLSERASLRIDKLSGGQRKRASIALELLTEPALLFLDEPTSGLDPGLDRQLMVLLKNLARGGRTVVVVTHTTANLDVCDDVLVMAPGGRVAYFGSPLTVLKSLESNDWAEAFEKLGTRQKSSTRSVSQKLERKPILRFEAPMRRQPWLHQLKTLCKRYISVIAADPPYVAFLFAMPVLLALVGFISGDNFGLGGGDDASFGLNPQARSLLLIFILGCSFMGIAASIQEVVKEKRIFSRERGTGLSPTAYIFSKIVVLGILVVFQAASFVFLSLLGRPTPDQGLVVANSTLELLIPAALLSFVSMLLGLLISQFAKTTDVALPALVIATMAQVVLSGAVPLRYEEISETLGLVVPAYWSMNAMASTSDLNTLMGHVASAEILSWESSSTNWNLTILVLGSLALLGVLALAAVSKHITPRQQS